MLSAYFCAGSETLPAHSQRVYDALSGSFAKNQKGDRMSSEQRVAFLVIGRIGLTARACVFALVGYFLLKAAIAFEPRSAVGIDGALDRLRHQDLGPLLLGIAAAGLIVFAAFSVMEARYRRL